MDVSITPKRINAVAANTGLSPEFHFADFKIGKAGSFCRPFLRSLLCNQSVKSHRSSTLLLDSVLLLSVADDWSSSKYSLTAPDRLLIAKLVRDTGTCRMKYTYNVFSCVRERE